MIKINIKGKILDGNYSPIGEVMVKDDKETTGGYYIYVWPNTGETFPGSDIEIVYDTWYDDFTNVEGHFQNNSWKVEWY